VALLPRFWFFENIYPISIRLGIPLKIIICYSSAVSEGFEHLLLPWNAGFGLWRIRECLMLYDVALAQGRSQKLLDVTQLISIPLWPHNRHGATALTRRHIVFILRASSLASAV
jgi:hypothetical protein